MLTTIKHFFYRVFACLVAAFVLLLAVSFETSAARSIRILEEGGATLTVALNPDVAVGVVFADATITTEVAQEVVKNTRIHTLTFDRCTISRGVFPLLSSLSDLHSLTIMDSTCESDIELAGIFADVDWQVVSLNRVSLIKGCIDQLNTERLGNLLLHNCGTVTFDDVLRLAQSPQIEYLSCRGVSLTQDKFRELRSQSPDLRLTVVDRDFEELKPFTDVGVEFELDQHAEVVGLTLRNSEESPTDLYQFQYLKRVNLVQSNVNAELMAALTILPQLHSLSLEKSHVDSGALPLLSQISSLRKLNLDRITVDENTVVVLPDLPQLHWLQAYSDAVTDATFETADLRSLESISLGRNVTEAGISQLSRLAQLRSIAVDYSMLNADVNEAISSLEQLTHLVVLDKILQISPGNAWGLRSGFGSNSLWRDEETAHTIDCLRKLSPSLAVMHW